MKPPCPYGAPALTGVIRRAPEDFRVTEHLGFELTGAGEHLYVDIEKTSANTDWVAGQLARLAGVRRRDIGYAGRKDRHAVTRQWFSIWLPGNENNPDPEAWEIPGVRVLGWQWHARKLKTGSLAGNNFDICVRDLQGEDSAFDDRLAQLVRNGAPNYFGAQRFGRQQRNLAMATELFSGRRLRRNDRSMALSAARAALFNAVLAKRVSNQSWLTPQIGDCLMLAGSRSFFLCETTDETVSNRHASGDIHVSGPLWGRGKVLSEGAVAVLETSVTAELAGFCEGLEKAGLSQERRSLRVFAQDCEVDRGVDWLRMRFNLPPGSFATTIINQLVCCGE